MAGRVSDHTPAAAADPLDRDKMGNDRSGDDALLDFVRERQAGMAESRAQVKDNPKAELAFADYVALGASRSLRALHAQYLQQTTSKPPAKSIETLFRWSSQHNWQGRIAAAATARSDAMLNEAAQIDADTFLISSRHLHKQVNDFASYPDTVIKIRESVRKPMPKGGAVNVSIRVEIQSIVDRIAEEDGLNDSEKKELADAIERHLAATPT